jgi:hypothetical protein
MQSKKALKPAKKATAPQFAAELPIWVSQTAMAAVRNEVPELPEWVTETPEVTIQLAVFIDGDQRELIELTRDEYVYLKHMLAKMRGYIVPKAA